MEAEIMSSKKEYAFDVDGHTVNQTIKDIPTTEHLFKHLYRSALEINSGAALFLASILVSNNIFIYGPMMIIGTAMWGMGIIRMGISIGGLIGTIIGLSIKQRVCLSELDDDRV
jgi:hypothetical protein